MPNNKPPYEIKHKLPKKCTQILLSQSFSCFKRYLPTNIFKNVQFHTFSKGPLALPVG